MCAGGSIACARSRGSWRCRRMRKRTSRCLRFRASRAGESRTLLMPNYVPLEDFRARIESIPGGVEVSIPSRRNYAAAAFIAFWLCGWVFGLVTAGGQLLSPTHVGKDPPPELFLFVWLGL